VTRNAKKMDELLECSNVAMSALGQKQTWQRLLLMSA